MDTLNGCGQVRTGADRCEQVRAGAGVCEQVRAFHVTLRVSSRLPTEFVDLTDRLERLIAEAGLGTGLLNVQTRHTTTAIVVNEHEPLLLSDFQALLEAAAPHDGRYRHDDLGARTVNLTAGERPNGHAHCRALFLPSSACLNVTDGRLRLGRWQRVFFVELDGPQEREISVMVLGESGQ
ncbi:MAG: YjbQ family protein [Acidobacteria bacterium]|nr:YjbQ family protein [Acidobacteriota bacterium]